MEPIDKDSYCLSESLHGHIHIFLKFEDVCWSLRTDMYVFTKRKQGHLLKSLHGYIDFDKKYKTIQNSVLQVDDTIEN